jgi:hypothetical protein
VTSLVLPHYGKPAGRRIDCQNVLISEGFHRPFRFWREIQWAIIFIIQQSIPQYQTKKPLPEGRGLVTG